MPPRRTRRTPVAPASPAPVDALTAVLNKFDRLASINQQLAASNELRKEKANIVRELMPLFITRNESGDYTVKRQITLGTRVLRMSPSFFNEKKGILENVVWKSSAFEIFAIE